MDESQSITVGVMCFNEAGNIVRVLNDIFAFFNKNANTGFEVLVVDDGSADNSVELVQSLQLQYPELKLIQHPVNMGIGATLRDIYQGATKDLVVAVPGDGQFDINELSAHLIVPEKTFVNLYRVENTTYSLLRNGLSMLNKLVNRILLGLVIKDVNWILIFRTQDLHSLGPLKLKSSLVTSEICAKLVHGGCRVVEEKSKYLPRQAGKSRGASFKIVFKAAKDTLKLMWVIWNYKLKNKKNNI